MTQIPFSIWMSDGCLAAPGSTTFSLTKPSYMRPVWGNPYVGAKLTDQPKHRQDLELWRLILDVNHYYRGFAGIKQTWYGMKWRGTQVRLGEENATAMELWETFISAAAINDIAFLEQICEDCIEKQMLTTRLFPDTVAGLLRYKPEHAPKIAYTLQLKGLGTSEGLLDLFKVACESEVEGALQSFRDVRALFSDIKLYCEVVPTLLKLNRIDDAIKMHDALVSQADLPKCFNDIAPFIQYFATLGASIDPFLRGLRAAGVSFDNQARQLYALAKAKLGGSKVGPLNVNVSSMFEKERKSVKDETIARTLATRGFSFDFVLKLLQPFGLIEFGPYSVRQMALTSESLTELRSRFAKLQELGIDLGSSAYMRIVKKLSDSGESELLSQFIQTDMHHEEFEDNGLQKSLVNDYLKKRDIMQLSRSLAILKLGEISSRARSSAVSLVLRSAVDTRDWAGVLQMIQVFREHEYKVDRSVIRHLHSVLTALAKGGADGGPADKDYVGFLVGVLQQLLVSGYEVHPADWIWPLRILGHSGRLEEAERLALWLAAYYRRSDGERWSADWALNIIFHEELLLKIISGSFRKVSWKHSWPNELQSPGTPPWLRGAALLKKLRDEYGVVISLPSLQRVFTANVSRMYGAEPTSRMLANRRHAERRCVKVDDYLASWSTLWAGETYERTDLPPLESSTSTVSDGMPHKLTKHESN